MSDPHEQASTVEELYRYFAGRDLRHLVTCDSTNRVARRALDAGAGEGLLVVSEGQSAGRGRLGRRWDSPPGENLLFSLVLRPRVPLERAACAVLGWSAAMAEVLDCRLKWPNDLQDEAGLKLGGLLSELYTLDPAHPEDWCVILGVGINVNQETFPDLPGATSLRRMRGQVYERASLLHSLVLAIEEVDVAHPLALQRWRQRSNTLGQQVRVGTREGRAEAIREDGALIVDGEPVLAGDVEILSWADED